MLGITFINEIVQKKIVFSVSDLLDLLRTSVIEALKQKGKLGETQDGMDIAFISIDLCTLEMEFAGANNPCWIFRPEEIECDSSDYCNPGISNVSICDSLQNERKEVLLEKIQQDCIRFIELKPDKMPIGIHPHMEPFTTKKIQLKKGDVIYLKSDGYEDQFGGPNRRKFLSKNMKQLMEDNAGKPMGQQKIALVSTIFEWMGKMEQIDDITILGIKI
jgi:hypothetical protein